MLLATFVTEDKSSSRRGAKLSPSETNTTLAPLPLTLCEGRIGCAGGVGDYQIAPIAARSTAMGRWRLTPPWYGDAACGRDRRRKTPHPPPSGAPVSLRVGRSAGLTRHRRVIQHREPLKGKAWGGAPLSNTGHSRGRLGGLYCALILLPALPNMSFQAPSTLAASSWASWASSSAVTSPSGVWPRISSAT